MAERERLFFKQLHREFHHSLLDLDCGEKCGPFNDYGVPVCCDIQLTIPAAYQEEWEYLQAASDLWFPWTGGNAGQADLDGDVQDGQVLLQCRGYQHCQREYRTLSCRSFPFYPYLNSQKTLLGLAYFQDYRDTCWVISNLGLVSTDYKTAFKKAFNSLFEVYPRARDEYASYASFIRQRAASGGDDPVLMDFSSRVFRVNPTDESLQEISFQDLESFGPYQVTRELRFPDEEAG